MFCYTTLKGLNISVIKVSSQTLVKNVVTNSLFTLTIEGTVFDIAVLR